MNHRAPPARAPRRAIPFALAAAAALTACGAAEAPPAPPPASPIPAYAGSPDPTPPQPSALPQPAGAPSAFAALRDRVLDRWIDDDPSFGRDLGLHASDGKIGDYSAAAIAARLTRAGQQLRELTAVDRASLSPDEALDLALMIRELDLFLFHQQDLAEWQRRPQFYAELFAVNAYLERDYAPIEERAARLLAHEKASLAQIPHIRENLVSPLSRPVVETAIRIYAGYAEYLRGDVVRLLKGVGSPALQEDLAKTNEKLAAAAQALAAHLKSAELPKADESHILGVERYRKLLMVQEGLTTPLGELKKMGEDNLAENKRAFEALAPKAKFTRPKPQALLAEATRLLESARKYIVDKNLVTIPSDERAVVEETPPFMRWNAAFLNAPGPFESKATTAFYYVTRPDPSWTKKEQDDYLMPFGMLASTTVHEAYPGHFLQHLWAKRAPTRAQQMFGAYSFVEGWAHYGEQMMIEEGFGAEDPQSRLGQLADALLRNCRVVVSLGVHTEKISMAEAARRFVADCHQDKATAREQAARAAFDPGYFAYTLGKLQILALREEAKRLLGPKFSLQRFHDALLAHGSPPVALIRERVLHDVTEAAK
jgi:uncharacterized protein (DUF885 family)